MTQYMAIWILTKNKTYMCLSNIRDDEEIWPQEMQPMLGEAKIQ